LLLAEQLRTDSCSDTTEDLVMYVKTAVCGLEFCVALAVVAFGVYECVFGKWNWVSALILTAHFYFNVWERLRQGWAAYRLRRAALRRVERLRPASAEELRLHNDVCSICHAEMREARRTDCGHYFHASCLRKWLGRSSTCPFCLTRVPDSVSSPAAASASAVGGGGGGGGAVVLPAGGAAVHLQQQQDESSEEAVTEVLDTESSIFDDEDVDLGLYYDGDGGLPRRKDDESVSSFTSGEDNVELDPGSDFDLEEEEHNHPTV
jgi:hypothetical protein